MSERPKGMKSTTKGFDPAQGSPVCTVVAPLMGVGSVVAVVDEVPVVVPEVLDGLVVALVDVVDPVEPVLPVPDNPVPVKHVPVLPVPVDPVPVEPVPPDPPVPVTGAGVRVEV